MIWCAKDSLRQEFISYPCYLTQAATCGLSIGRIGPHAHGRQILFWFVALRPSQQLWSIGTVSSPNHTFFLGKLEQAVNQYFVTYFCL